MRKQDARGMLCSLRVAAEELPAEPVPPTSASTPMPTTIVKVPTPTTAMTLTTPTPRRDYLTMRPESPARRRSRTPPRRSRSPPRRPQADYTTVIDSLSRAELASHKRHQQLLNREADSFSSMRTIMLEL